MAVRPIRILPDPVLRKKAVRVRNITPALRRLVDDMIDTMRAAEGVGLAANQVGELQRVAVIEVPDEEVRVLINPEIVRREGERDVEEGCLSIPGYRGALKRSEQVTVRALDRNGKSFRIKATGLLAQALEHETDHLNGVLYVSRLESKENLFKIVEQEADGAEEAEKETSAAEVGRGKGPAHDTA